MKRLLFAESDKDKDAGVAYYIYNSKDQFLGLIKRQRVGRFMHWCFFPDAVEEMGDIWFSNGCLKEISQFITSLYAKNKGQKPSTLKSPPSK